MNNQTQPKIGKIGGKSKYTGRKPGSFSFVNISVGDILSKLSEDDTVPVYGKWASMMEFKGLVPISKNQIVKPLKSKLEIRKAITITDLNIPKIN